MSALSDLRRKRALETQFARELNGLWAATVRTFVRVLSSTGALMSVRARVDEPMRQLIRRQYQRSADAFSNQLRPKLPKDVEATPEEDATITTALARIFDQRADAQAALIGETTQKQMAMAVERADKQVADQVVPATSRERAILAGQILASGLRGRTPGIAAFETQWSAETSKGVEALVLTGVDPDRSGIKARHTKTVAMKQWRSQGDSRVRGQERSDRFNHLLPDGQRVKASEPFIVSGQLLLWPGDTSRGASIGNIARCRCSALYDVETIRELREELNAVRDDITIVEDVEDPFARTDSDLIVGFVFDPIGKPPSGPTTAPPAAPLPTDVPVNDTLHEVLGIHPQDTAMGHPNSKESKAWARAVAAYNSGVMPDIRDLQLLESVVERNLALMKLGPPKRFQLVLANMGSAEMQRKFYRATDSDGPNGKEWRFNHHIFDIDTAITKARSELASIGWTGDAKDMTFDQAKVLADNMKGLLVSMNRNNDVPPNGSIENFSSTGLKLTDAATAREILKILREASEDGVMAGNLWTLKMENIQYSSWGDRRAQAFDVLNEIWLADNESPDIIAHELSHHAEFRNKSVLDRVMGGRERREQAAMRSGETAMSQINGREDEWGFKDEFFDHYVGRNYPNGWTEVLSMATQALYNPEVMRLMVKDDPEHVELMFSVMRGY